MGSRLDICVGVNSYSDEEKEHLAKLEEKYSKRIVVINKIVLHIILIYENRACY